MIRRILLFLTLVPGFCPGDFDGQSDDEDEHTNRLLTYLSTDSEELYFPTPRLKNRFRIMYSTDIDPANLVVELDGEDITHLFSPQPNSFETVDLPIIVHQSKRLTLRIPERLEDDSVDTPMWDYDEFRIDTSLGESLMIAE